jgi:hypothetical protein
MGAFRRKWTRPWLLVLVVLAIAGIAACSSGDDDEDGDGQYDFNGTWAMNETVVQSNVPQFPVGLRGTDVARITQSGTSITVVIEDVAPMAGTCDPVAGTFTVAGSDGPVAIQMNGVKVDEDTVSGELTMSGGPVLIRFTYTMNLTSRNRSASNPAAGNGIAAVLRTLR